MICVKYSSRMKRSIVSASGKAGPCRQENVYKSKKISIKMRKGRLIPRVHQGSQTFGRLRGVVGRQSRLRGRGA